MQNAFRFETPENVQVQYEPAGLGTRFLAWIVDQIVVWFGMIGLFVILVLVGASFDLVFEAIDDDEHAWRAMLYFFGLMTLIWGLGSFLYFGACELLLRGQTIGKRISNIRVVKADGFQLDSASVVLRNLFRVVDHMPPMWIIPVLSKLSQRAGDMVAGTVVVADAPTQLSPVRAALASRTAAEARFRFDQAQLARLNGTDYEAVERLLDRWPELPPEQQGPLLDAYARQLAQKLRIDPPPVDAQLRFLEDLYAAELRRQDRHLV